jgi:hypothetical protein
MLQRQPLARRLCLRLCWTGQQQSEQKDIKQPKLKGKPIKDLKCLERD